MTPPAALGAIWNGPPVECWTCGVSHVPRVLVPTGSLAVAFWGMPAHSAWLTSGSAPLCSGSGQLIGPVRT